MTDAKLQVTTYQYDALNRLTRENLADGSVISYEYDSAPNGIGRPASITDSSGSTHWSYDLHGRITEKRQSILIDGIESALGTHYRYNGAGQLEQISYPSGLVVAYRYSQGRLSGLEINGMPFLEQIGYEPFGPVNGWIWADGRQHSRRYGLDGYLTEQSLGGAMRTLSYDALGNIVQMETGNNITAYSYDALSRITKANDAVFSLSWDYDANGNRLSENDTGLLTSYSIDTSSNRLLAINETPYRYDANGNLIDDGEHSYRYNARNRLVSVDNDETGRYRHNALGQRVYKKGRALAGDTNGDGIISADDLKSVNGNNAQSIDCEGPGQGKGRGQQVACVARQIGDFARQGSGNKSEQTLTGNREIWFAYNEAGQLIGEYSRNGTPIQETVYLGKLPVATIRQDKVYAIHTDHLGTPRVITDNGNKIIWRWESDPFGEAKPEEDPDGDGVRFTYNLRFAGQYYDSETGKHYNYFRDYNPSTGRYIESDPIGLAGGLNTYAYVVGNPIGFIDPYGEDVQEMWDSVLLVGLYDAWKAGTEDADKAKKLADQARYKDRDGIVRPLPGEGHGAKNAYTHCLVSCLMAQRLGPADAERIGEFHEESGERRGNGTFDRNMDLYNNAVGCKIGGKYPNEENACPDKCLEKLFSGELREVKGLGRNADFELIPTDVHRYPVDGLK